MQRYYLILFIFALVSSYGAMGQSGYKKPKMVKKADQLYDQYAYYEAALLYQKAWQEKPDRPETALQLARCYYQLREPVQSVQWYEKAKDNLRLFTDNDKLYFAQVLESSGDQEQAKTWYQAYGRETGKNEQIAPMIRAIDQQEVFSEDSASYQVRQVSFNSPQSDFSPVYYEKGLIYVSAREDKGSSKKRYGWNNQFYLNLYYAEKKGENFSKPQPLSKTINSTYHEGPAAFYDNNTKMIFTRNSYYGGQKELNQHEINRLHLFMAEKAGSSPVDWKNVQPFPYNSNNYSVGHPTITADGSKLYFISDMPGSIGGTDIYVCYWKGDTWGIPQNLGKLVNTEGNEMFPFIHQNGNLYFSSDGHGGLGGLDVFKINMQAEADSARKVINVGVPVNSKSDDFGFILNPEETQGFFSSNRTDQGDNDDLFQFTYSPVQPAPKPKKKVIVTVSGEVIFTKDKQPMDSSQVVVKDKAGTTIAQIQTEKAGSFKFTLEADTDYSITASKQGFIAYKRDINTDKNLQDIELPLGKEAKVTGTLSNKDTGKPLTHTKLELTDIQTQAQQEDVTDDKGQYDFLIVSEHEYQLKVKGDKKYFNKPVKLDGEAISNGTIQTDIAVEEIVLHKAITIENIYYDLNSAKIRPEAALELNKLVKVLKDNPNIVIELSSHTDARGSDKSNLDLSDKRAKAAAAYIVSQGISATRIVGKGYGEYKLVNNCTDDVDCTEQQHQQNRRTEFAVIKY